MKKNVEFQLEGNILLIKIDLTQELGTSTSGKSMLIGTTSGNVTVPGTDVKVGLNVYRPQQQDAGGNGR